MKSSFEDDPYIDELLITTDNGKIVRFGFLKEYQEESRIYLDEYESNRKRQL